MTDLAWFGFTCFVGGLSLGLVIAFIERLRAKAALEIAGQALARLKAVYSGLNYGEPHAGDE
jgi:hypothetical protein